MAKFRSFNWVVALIGLALIPSCAMNSAAEPSTIYLVRHAEKQAGDDPELTVDGSARAERLAGLMAQAHVGKIWSTDTKRTRATAQPSSEALDVPIALYDPSDLSGFAEMLRAENGVILVVGHSNTTPDLASALTGRDEGEEFDHADYESLFRVDLNALREAVAYKLSYDSLERSLED